MTENAPDRYVLTQRAEAVSTLHRNPGEECNTDDAGDREVVDQDTGRALLALGQARRCGHCNTEEDPAT